MESMAPVGRKPERKVWSDVNGHYEPDEVEFMLAMTALKHELGRMPDYREILAEAKRQGYRKVNRNG